MELETLAVPASLPIVADLPVPEELRFALDALAECLDYPSADSAAAARRAIGCLGVWNGAEKPVVAALDALAAWLAGNTLAHAEERYTTLFDLAPVCTLNVGFHLFGETYERGAFLAGLAGELRAAELAVGSEIADHLPVLLRLLTRLADAGDRRILAATVLVPALSRMKTALGEASDPWTPLLVSLPDLLAEVADCAAVSALELPVHA